jgi:hypothetical protein
MNFKIEKREDASHKELSYSISEYSFDMNPANKVVAFTILVNYLDLAIGNDRRIVNISGYSPSGSWEINSFMVPQSQKGDLIVISDLEEGFSYRLNTEGDWPVYQNKNTGWICIGSPEKGTEAVEFIDNCIAVLENEKLISLWLKPKWVE